MFFLVKRIKGIPTLLNKQLFYENLNQGVDTIKNDMKYIGNLTSATFINIIISLSISIPVGCEACYYIFMSKYIDITYFTVLTALELVTVIIFYIDSLKFFKSFDTEDVKFNKAFNCFNVVLDVVYYLLGIYLLLIK